MKKAAAILLLFLFLITNSAMAVNVHWCHGKITTIKFFDGDEHGCKCGKKAMKRGCCKDKTIVFKANLDPAKANQFVFKVQIPKFEFTTTLPAKITASSQIQHFTSDFYRPPLFKLRTPIFLADRVILI